jgi:hypothetical protein
VYGLMPLVGRLPGTEPVNRRYQTVIFWGGLRGGIALGIALALPPIPGRDTIFVPVAMGAVLFTMLVQGLTVEKLVRYLGLDVPPLSDRVARIEGLLSAKQRTLEQIPELQAGGLFSPRIADAVRAREFEHQRGTEPCGHLPEPTVDHGHGAAAVADRFSGFQNLFLPINLVINGFFYKTERINIFHFNFVRWQFKGVIASEAWRSLRDCFVTSYICSSQ